MKKVCLNPCFRGLLVIDMYEDEDQDLIVIVLILVFVDY